MRPSVQALYRRYGKLLGRARLIRIPGHLVLQTVDLPSYLTYGIRNGILPLDSGNFECMYEYKMNVKDSNCPQITIEALLALRLK
jgi:hypothetical protein